MVNQQYFKQNLISNGASNLFQRFGFSETSQHILYSKSFTGIAQAKDLNVVAKKLSLSNMQYLLKLTRLKTLTM